MAVLRTEQGFAGCDQAWEGRAWVVIGERAGEEEKFLAFERFRQAAVAQPVFLMPVQGQQGTGQGDATTGQGNR